MIAAVGPDDPTGQHSRMSTRVGLPGLNQLCSCRWGRNGVVVEQPDQVGVVPQSALDADGEPAGSPGVLPQRHDVEVVGERRGEQIISAISRGIVDHHDRDRPMCLGPECVERLGQQFSAVPGNHNGHDAGCWHCGRGGHDEHPM
jgi:hypothetical protein